MSRRLAVVAFLVCAGPAFVSGAEEPEKVLAGKTLIRSGASYLLRAEDDVKKAADAADAKLREYRRASAWDKDSVRGEAEKKALAADLTKQRAAMKEQMPQVQAQLQAQIQELQMEQAMLQQQRGSMGGRYGGRYAQMGSQQIAGQANQIGYQIRMLQQQGQQLTAEYNAMGTRIEMLNPKPGSDIAKAQAAEKPKVSTKELKDEYVEAVAALRKVVDETKKQYEAVAADPTVKSALASLDQHSAKVKHTLGPSKRFLDTVKALDEAEKKIASDSLDPSEPTRSSVSAKRKTLAKTLKRK